jgi:hypothetical protein
VALVRGSASTERHQALSRPLPLIIAVMALSSRVGSAQVSTDSAKAQISPDSARAQTTDSVPRQGTDSSGAARTDTSAAQRPATGAAPPPPATPPDTLLANACRGTLPGRPAAGLLTVVFKAGTPDSSRVAAAKEVSAAFIRVPETGEEYVRLSPESGPFVVASAKLIQLPAVTSVSEKSCP